MSSTNKPPIKTQYLITIHRPHGYNPSLEDAPMHAAITALNDEMRATGVTLFVGGLQSPQKAKTLRAQPDSSNADVRVTDGLYPGSDEFVGGLWVLELDGGMDEAVEWGRKAAVACRAGVEVRAFERGRGAA